MEDSALRPVEEGCLRVVLDTDTANEIDDQFAVVWALLSGERIGLEALYATQFVREPAGAHTAAEGVQQSEDEILRLLERMDVAPQGRVLRGAEATLPDAHTAVANAASDDLIARARATPAGETLWVAAIGALTNVASALLAAPEIAERIVVVWLGGQALHAPSADEYNLRGDPDALRAVLASAAPMAYIPCYGAASHLLATVAELDAYVRPQGAIGAYLADIFAAHDEQYPGRSKEIWDLAAIAYLIDPSSTPVDLRPRPTLNPDLTWGPPQEGAPFGEVRYVARDPIFADLFRKLSEFARGDLAPVWPVSGK